MLHILVCVQKFVDVCFLLLKFKVVVDVEDDAKAMALNVEYDSYV